MPRGLHRDAPLSPTKIKALTKQIGNAFSCELILRENRIYADRFAPVSRPGKRSIGSHCANEQSAT